MTKYDIIVVGGGPIGSTYAYKMAKLGYTVAVFDMKNRIGQPLQCAGLVSTNIDDTGNLPKEFILNNIKGANLFSPDKTTIAVQKQDTAAYVLDRVLYDKYLFDRAINSGVEPHMGTAIKDVDINNTTIKTDSNRKYDAKLIAVAVGPNSRTSLKMNPQLNEESFLGVQYTVKTDNQDMDYVHVGVDAAISPGFMWKIPVSSGKMRVGLFTKASLSIADRILKTLILDDSSIIEKHYGIIPRFNIKKKIVQNNTILIGDSASQVKPTTGGGLVSGFACTGFASANSDKMLETGDNKYLKGYEDDYHKKYDGEFRAQQNVQNIMESLTNDDFNYMFKQLKEYGVGRIISEHGDMDYQIPLLKELIKTGVIFKLLPKIGVRRLKNIWKSL